MKFLPLIWAGLWRKRARTIFTLASAVVAFMLFGVLQSVNAILSSAIDVAHVNRLYTVSRLSLIDPLPMAYLAQIEAVAGVSHVAYFQWFGGYYQEPRNNIIAYPINPERTFAVFSDWQIPKDQLQAMIRTRTGAIIGRQLAQRYGWKIGDHVPLRTTIWTKKDGSSLWAFDIVGIYDDETKLQNNLFLLNYELFDQARNFGQGMVGWYALTVTDPTRTAAVGAAIDKLFVNSANETKTQNEKEWVQARIRQLGDIGFMVNAIVGAVLFTLLFLTGNAMMQSLRERIPELAVMKTIGFTDRALMLLVLAESLVLCMFGAVLGIGIAAAVFPAIGSALGGEGKLSAVVWIWALGAALLLALATGVPPAWRANRLSIVNALAGR